MSEKIESRDGLPPPRLHVGSEAEASPSSAVGGNSTPTLSAQVKELTKELRAQLDETQRLLDRARLR